MALGESNPLTMFKEPEVAEGGAKAGLSMGATGAAIGTAILPGVGTAIGAGVGLFVGGLGGGLMARRKWEEQQKQQEKLRKKQEKLAYRGMREKSRRGVEEGGAQSAAVSDAYARFQPPETFTMTTAAPGVSSYDAYKARKYGG